ncbi:MAG: hypothetical protein RR559_12285, partial [Bacteroides sp.]
TTGALSFFTANARITYYSLSVCWDCPADCNTSRLRMYPWAEPDWIALWLNEIYVQTDKRAVRL